MFNSFQMVSESNHFLRLYRNDSPAERTAEAINSVQKVLGNESDLYSCVECICPYDQRWETFWAQLELK